MNTQLQLNVYQEHKKKLSYYVPDLSLVQVSFNKCVHTNKPVPYWAKVWPAAFGLCSFLVQQPYYIYGKNVLELAGGLGLPSLVAAEYAKHICFSDYNPEAVDIVKKSVDLNGFTNIDCEVLDWRHLPSTLKPDVLLLSDVNYDPSDFDVLYDVIKSFLKNGSIVILSTPQRLMAKPFIGALNSWCRKQEEVSVVYGQQEIKISVFVLAEEDISI
jgi:predicted nicotinamide N-methyase